MVELALHFEVGGFSAALEEGEEEGGGDGDDQSGLGGDEGF